MAFTLTEVWLRHLLLSDVIRR